MSKKRRIECGDWLRGNGEPRHMAVNNRRHYKRLEGKQERQQAKREISNELEAD